jgi:hypothetical protein
MTRDLYVRGHTEGWGGEGQRPTIDVISRCPGCGGVLPDSPYRLTERLSFGRDGHVTAVFDCDHCGRYVFEWRVSGFVGSDRRQAVLEARVSGECPEHGGNCFVPACTSRVEGGVLGSTRVGSGDGGRVVS